MKQLGLDGLDGADKDEEYTYDANGNMTCDRNKGIHSITYNMLNLPEKVLFNDGHETRYTYAADGRKLRTEYRLNNFAIIEADKAEEEAEPANPGTFSLPSVGEVIDHPTAPIEPLYTTLMTRDYCGNYIYSNGTLERILTDNGYIQDDEFYFYIKDYQGNIRVVLNQANVPVELNSYYPYGALMAATATEGTQPYKYSAKELDRQNGLDLYDSQARHYDPIIPRTTTMDPKSETYYPISPYTWCAANPLEYVDDDGKWIRGVKGKRVYFNEKTNKWTNATPDIMTMGNEMAKTKVGLQVLKNMLNVKYPINIVFDRVKVKREDKGVLLGLTTPSLILDKYGKKQFKSVKIELYLKAIADVPHRDEKLIGLSELEILGAVAVHEGEHGTNKAASSSFYPEGRNSKAEDLATFKETQHLEQLKQQKNNNRQQEE